MRKLQFERIAPRLDYPDLRRAARQQPSGFPGVLGGGRHALPSSPAETDESKSTKPNSVGHTRNLSTRGSDGGQVKRRRSVLEAKGGCYWPERELREVHQPTEC